jgi:hypothetical protein
VPERPQAIATLEALLGATLVAHETIYDLHRSLVSARVAAESSELVRESAEITLDRAPALATEARRLISQLSEESLLDPPQAESTARQLPVEVRRIEPELRALLARQIEIVRQLRTRLGREPG